MDINGIRKNKLIFGITFLILLNVFWVLFSYSNQTQFNPRKLTVIDELNGDYVSSISDNQETIGILNNLPYISEDQPNSNHSYYVYKANTLIGNISIENNYKPVFIQDGNSYFIKNSGDAMINETTTILSFPMLIYSTNDGIEKTNLTISIENIYYNNSISFSSYVIKIFDTIEYDSIIYFSFEFHFYATDFNNQENVDGFGLAKLSNKQVHDVNIFYEFQDINPYQLLLSHVEQDFVLTIISDISGDISLTKTFSVLQYKISLLDNSFTMTDNFTTSCYSYCDLIELDGEILSFSRKYDNVSKILIKSAKSNTTLYSGEIEGNLSSYPIKASDHQLGFFPNFAITKKNAAFFSAYNEFPYYYLFDINNPSKVSKIWSNPNNYEYYNYDFISIADGYLTIIHEQYDVNRFNLKFLIQKENSILNTVQMLVYHYKWPIFAIQNIFIIAVIIFPQHRKNQNGGLFPKN